MKALLLFPPTYIAAGVALIFWPPLRENFWIGTSALGGLIVLYAICARGEEGSNREKAGDNCYFIGFVYTLAVVAISLAAAARFWRKNSDLPIEEAGTLVSAVAVALSTSVVGMVLRFIVGHQLETPQDELERQIERAARQIEKIESAAARLDSAVEKIADDAETMKDSLGDLSRSSLAWADSFDNAARAAGDGALREAEKLLAALGERIDDALAQTRFDKIRDDLQAAVDAHRDAAKKIADSLERSLSRLDAAAAGGKERAKALDGAVSKIKAAVAEDKWSAVGEAVSQFASLRDSLRSIAESAAADVARAEKTRASFDALAAGMRADIESIAALKAAYRRAHEDAAKTALAETHKLYAQLIGGAQVALAGLDDLRGFARDLRVVVERVERIEKARGGEEK